MTKLTFLGKKTQHLSCGKINLKAGDSAEFSDDMAKSLLESYPEDFKSHPEHAPGENKMAKKRSSFKSK